MKFSKFRNSIRNTKTLTFIIAFISISNQLFSQSTQNNNIQNNGATDQSLINNTNTNNGNPQSNPKRNLPDNYNTSNNVKKNSTTSRVPTNNATNIREMETNPFATKAIELEDKNKVEKLTEIEMDEAKSMLIKRIFGRSLFNNTMFDATSAVNIATPSNYVLGPGDKINSDIYGYSQFKQSSVVNADGYVVLDKAGVVQVAGLSIEEAEKKIKSAYSKIFIGMNGGNGYPANTFLKVSLSGYRSIKIKITGEVIAPGTYTVTSFTSLLNAIYSCGGPNEIGTYREIKLIRNNRVISILDLYDVITKGFSKSDVLLKDQDVIYVGPYISRIAINGYLKRNGLFEVLPNESLNDAINYAGGFDQYAYSEKLKIYRNTSIERKIIDVKSQEYKSNRVFTGDSIVVEKLLERFENMINIKGAIYRPGEYSLDTNPTLLTLIKSASGLKEDALLGRITIIRTNDDLTTSNISINYSDIKSGLTKDIALKRQDKIVIPSLFDMTEPSTIKIQGAINNPDAKEGVVLPYIKNMTIQDLLVRVGGLTEAASLTRVEIVRRKRNVDPKQVDAQISDIMEFDINSDLSVESNSRNTVLLPYDEVFVRTSPNYEKQYFVTIKGQVIYPGIYGIKFKDEKVSDLIARCGGLSPIAYVKGATLVRKTLISNLQRDQRIDLMNNLNINAKIKEAKIDGEIENDVAATKTERNVIVETIGIDLEKILQNPGSVSDIILQDDDEINIPIRLQTIRIQGEILYPTSVKYLPQLKFMDYISKSGGFTKKSARTRAFVIYPNGSVDRTRKFLFARIFPKIEPGCEIIVPAKISTPQSQLAQFSGITSTVAATLTTLVSMLGLFKILN